MHIDRYVQKDRMPHLVFHNRLVEVSVVGHTKVVDPEAIIFFLKKLVNCGKRALT